MARRLFTALSILSLVLCLGSAGLWICGKARPVVLEVEWPDQWPDNAAAFTSVDGQFCLLRCHTKNASQVPGLTLRYSHALIVYVVGIMALGEPTPSICARFFGTGEYIVLVPGWLVVAEFSVLPLGLAVRRLRHRRPHRLFSPACGSCGYNLTANTSGVCPECGTAATPRESVGN